MRKLLHRLRLHRLSTWIGLSLAVTALVALQAVMAPSRHPNLSTGDFKSLRLALDTIQSRAYYADRIEWSSASDAAFAKANETGDITGALQNVLRQLGDSHSRYLNPAEARKWDRNPTVTQSTIRTWNRDGITYLSIPTFAGTTESSTDAFAGSIRAALSEPAKPDQAVACGWIVDLRQNHGGNMQPMLQGIEALVGSGTYFEWQTKPSAIARWLNRPVRQPAWRINETSVPQLDPRRPLAVLQGRGTISAGELLLISLRGRPNTKTFGEATAGKPSANEVTLLPNGGALAVTISLAVDRGGTLWTGPIPPDVSITSSAEAEAPDATLERAEDWIRSFECASAASLPSH